MLANEILKLNQIARVDAGYPFRGKIPEEVDTGVVAVQMKDVSISEGIAWSQCLSTDITNKRDPGWLHAGDILIAARGSHNYAVQVDDGLSAAGLKAVAAPQFFVIRITHPSVLPGYLVWLLNQVPCQRYFEQNAEGTLTKSIRRSVVEATAITVPSISRQQAIVALADVLRHEQRLYKQLLLNGELMMSAIAKDLYDGSGR